ncbi:Hypothetical_protein [Hexamita inflata]|uniref:Hypothetical_protein n=1 Tax=Hexamita inflata TaxID=28002 RepID=A0AA86RD25_9EUKA|nr:Hypothetical protein HINF_LOCUS57864 [Hexamita inflata]
MKSENSCNYSATLAIKQDLDQYYALIELNEMLNKQKSFKNYNQIFETENKQVQNKQTNEKTSLDKLEVFNPFSRLPKNQFNTDYLPQKDQCENKQNEVNQNLKNRQQIQPLQSPKIITETAQNQQIPFKCIKVNPNQNIADLAEANVVQNDTTKIFQNKPEIPEQNRLQPLKFPKSIVEPIQNQQIPFKYNFSENQNTQANPFSSNLVNKTTEKPVRPFMFSQYKAQIKGQPPTLRIFDDSSLSSISFMQEFKIDQLFLEFCPKIIYDLKSETINELMLCHCPPIQNMEWIQQVPNLITLYLYSMIFVFKT